jgi:hypothetical protein
MTVRLSALQKFIVLQCYYAKTKKVDRGGFLRFYENNKKAKPELWAKIITGSLESMIDRGLLLGYGMRTPKKWFLKEVSLTDIGKKAAKELLGKQLALPLKQK